MVISRLIKDSYLKSTGKTVSYLEDVSHNVGIYKWTNKVNGKVYIGQSKILDNRKWKFLSPTQKYSGDLINKAREKYNNPIYWNYEVLEYCNEDKLDEREIYYINLYNTADRKFGDNISIGGQPFKNTSIETKEKRKKSLYKPIYQIGLKTNNIIKEWEGAKAVERELGYDSSGITKVCKGKTVSLYGYRWAYVENPCIAKQNERRKKVQQYNINTDELINEFKSISEAATFINSEHIDNSITGISECCNGKRKSHKGYKWKFKE